MDLQKLLLSTTLASSLVLTGCGSDDEDSATAGAQYTGKTTNAILTDENSEAISLEMQAAVKAVSFVRYEENLADYDIKHTASIEHAELLDRIFAAISTTLGDYFGEDAIPSTPIEGTCAQPGSARASGLATNLNISANEFCIAIDNIEVTLSGGFSFKLNPPNYSITLNNTVTTVDYANSGLVDNQVSASGSISYSVNGPETVLTVNTTVDFDGVAASANVTETCLSASCVIDADVLADNNTTYRVEGLTVTLNNGYRGAADFYLPELGKVEASFTGIQYCEDGSIGYGSIRIKQLEAQEEIGIDFNGCGVDANTSFYSEDEVR